MYFPDCWPKPKMLLGILLLVTIVKGQQNLLAFNDFEQKFVNGINQELMIPFEWETPNEWNDHAQKLLFYTKAITAMGKPIDKRSMMVKDTFKNVTVSLSLQYLTLMSQSTSHTLRLTAEESEAAIKGSGERRVASGSLSIGAGILGALSLILAPFTAGATLVGLGAAAALVAVPAAILGVYDMATTPKDEDYARMMNSLMNMTNHQINFTTEFLVNAADAMTDENGGPNAMDKADLHSVIYDLLSVTSSLEEDNVKYFEVGYKAPFTMKKVEAVAERIGTLEEAQKGLDHIENALKDNTNRTSIKAASDFVWKILQTGYRQHKRFEDNLKQFDVFSAIDPRYEVDDNELDEVLIEFSELNQQRVKRGAKKEIDKKIARFRGWLQHNYQRFKEIAEGLRPAIHGAQIAQVTRVIPATTKLVSSTLPRAVNTIFKGLQMTGQLTIAVNIIGGITNVASIGIGIYDVAIGAKMLSGSGTITDRLNEQADLLDASLYGTLALYEKISHTSTDEILANSMANVYLLSGIDLKLCDNYNGGTDGSGLRANLRVLEDNSTCSTQNLGTHYLGEWQRSQGLNLLGDCLNWPLPYSSLMKGEGLDFTLQNNGSDGSCIEHVEMAINFEKQPRITCPMDHYVWLESEYDYDYDYGAKSFTRACKTVTGIAQLTIAVPRESYGGTNSGIRFRFNFDNNKTCITNVLDNKGNDFGYPSVGEYRSDTLGACFDLGVEEEDLLMDNNGYRSRIEVEMINTGSDGLRIIGSEFYSNIGMESLRFKCDLPREGIFIDGNSELVNCSIKKPTFSDRSVHAIKLVPSKYIDAAYVKLCSGEGSGKECCSSSVAYYLYKGYPREMQKHLLRDCEGFRIKNNSYTIQLWDEYGNQVDGLDAIYLYSSRFQMSAPMHMCDGNDLADCNIPTNFRIQSIRFGIPNEWYAGTNSNIEVAFNSMGRNCSTGNLDKSFAAGDWMKFEKHELGDCGDFEIETDKLSVFINNKGSDALSVKEFHVFGIGKIPRMLKCYLPDEKEEYWVENESLKLKCS